MAIVSKPDDLVDRKYALDALPPAPREPGTSQQIELPSEKLAQPSSALSIQSKDACIEKQHGHSQTSALVWSHPPPPPTQPNDAILESGLSKGGNTTAASCPKYSKSTIPGTSLQPHLGNVNSYDQTQHMVRAEGSKTCYKCGKTFASNQGLRGHLSRVTPCDQEKSVSSRGRPASKTCSRCNKTFSSLQSLRIHMSRVNPCDQDNHDVSGFTALRGTTSSSAPALDSTKDLQKETAQKTKAKQQSRTADLKNRGRLVETEHTSVESSLSLDDSNQNEESKAKSDLKRKAPGEPFGGTGNGKSRCGDAKKPRMQENSVQEDKSDDSPADVSGRTPLNTTRSSQSISAEKMSSTEGSFVHRSNKGHGGDLLAGGCSCPPCVRRWARKLMNRMQQLEDEVLSLRQTKLGAAECTGSSSTDDTTRTTAPTRHTSCEPANGQSTRSLLSATSANGLPSKGFEVASASQNKPAHLFELRTATFQPLERVLSACADKAALNVLPESGGQPSHLEGGGSGSQRIDDDHQRVLSVLRAVGSNKQSLMNAYEHMNDQILLNERTVEESSNHVQVLVGYNPETAMDFRRQVAELRASIRAEKVKRDVTVAALIAHVWKPRRDEFRDLLSAQTQSSPCDEQAYHTKWAKTASQIRMKDKFVSDLERQMNALGEAGGGGRSRYAEMGELSSKMAAEYAAKMVLESERESLYTGLVKSSTRIRSLVRNALL